MKRRYIFLLILLIVCIGVTIIYKIWNRPFKDPLSGEAINVTAKQLFTDFSTNEAEAQKKYVPKKQGDKILEITGEINSTGKNKDGETYYMLDAGDENFGIKCVMDKGYENGDRKPGSKIVIRGFCAGYNMDVIINRCKTVN